MPRIGDETQQHANGHFGFSAVRVEDLNAIGSSEYTLVTIVADRSGSTSGFQADMEACLKEIHAACMKSPRADNLMIRFVSFNHRHKEEHGFKLLSQISPNDYDGTLRPDGMTALYDAAVNAIEATNNYGRMLLQDDFSVNGIVFVITDGDDNESVLTANDVKKELQRAVSGENMESLVSVLIAIGSNAHLSGFNTVVGFTQYIELKDANKSTLAKLADFVSKSISSQSQALNSGGASQTIAF